MTAVTKFMFNEEFEPESKAEPVDSSSPTEADADSAEESEEGEEEEEEEELPGYSEAQLEEAKAESFESGKLEGAREAASTIEKEILIAVQAISLNITELFGRQERANSILLRDGIGIAATIVRKLFPAMNEKNALGEIDRLVEHTLLRLIEEPRVVIRVNPELMEALGERIDDLKAGAGYEGRIVMKEDQSLAHGDCRMEWGDGSAERNVESLWQSIDQIVEGNLGTDQETEVHQDAIDLSPLGMLESKSGDNGEIDETVQTEDENDENNTKETAPPEVSDGEGMKPTEDSGIVDKVPGIDGSPDVGSDRNADMVEPDEQETSPEETTLSVGEDE